MGPLASRDLSLDRNLTQARFVCPDSAIMAACIMGATELAVVRLSACLGIMGPLRGMGRIVVDVLTVTVRCRGCLQMA